MELWNKSNQMKWNEHTPIAIYVFDEDRCTALTERRAGEDERVGALEAQLTTDHLGVFDVPSGATDSAPPLGGVRHLQPTLVWGGAIYQTDICLWSEEMELWNNFDHMILTAGKPYGRCLLRIP